MSTFKYAKNMKAKNGVVDVKVDDIWNGELPQPQDRYMRMKAALTAIAYPLIDNAKIESEGGRFVVSFPIKIKLPKGFTRHEADLGITALASI